MTAAERLPLVSVEDYLAAELASDVKHEYVGGYIHAMAGAKNVHNRVASNFVGALHSRLRGKRCQAFNSDTKVRVPQPTHTRFYYPDGMVVCEGNDADESFQDQPVVIAEVLSDSTRRVDLFEKRDAYLTLPSLSAYLLVEIDRASVTVYRRRSDATDESGLEAFDAELYTGLDATIALAEVEAELPLAELYERVEFGDA